MNFTPESQTYYLPKEMRKKMKRPLGNLIIGSPEEVIPQLSEYIDKEKPTKILVIGDFVTNNLNEKGIFADIYVIDHKIMRKSIKPLYPKTLKTIHVNNPPGTITSEAWNVVCKTARKVSNVSIIVNGEEDLLALPAIACSPLGSFVLYGQPQKGVVLVRVTLDIKRKVKALLKEMVN